MVLDNNMTVCNICQISLELPATNYLVLLDSEDSGYCLHTSGRSDPLLEEPCDFCSFKCLKEFIMNKEKPNEN